MPSLSATLLSSINHVRCREEIYAYCAWDEAVGTLVLSSRLLGLGLLACLYAHDQQEAAAQKQMKSRNKC